VRESPRLRRDIEDVRSGEVVYAADSIGEDTSAARMLEALGRATSSLDDQTLSGPPRGLMEGLLAGCDRTRGSLLLFRQGTPHMEESEVVPAGSDPLNLHQPTAGVTSAATLCSGPAPRFIGDLADEVFRDSFVSGTERLQAALIVPLSFGTQRFGGLVVYVTDSERSPGAAEQAYWKTAASLTSVFLAWQTDKNRAVASPRTAPRPNVATPDTSDS